MGIEMSIPTFAMWKKARAYIKGYWSYTYTMHEGSNIPNNNPYVLGSWAWHQFVLGNKKAMQDAQDSEK